MIDEARKEMIVSYSIGKEDIGLTSITHAALQWLVSNPEQSDAHSATHETRCRQ